MSVTNVVLAGSGGYGAGYVRTLLRQAESLDYVFKAVIDPFAANGAAYAQLLEANIPVYDSMDSFFPANKADLVIICTPLNLHYEQCVTAMQNGAHVLCEKPLAPTPRQVYELQKCADDNNRFLAVGFQMSFSDVMLKVKTAVMNGEYGKPVRFKTYVSWPRPNKYYEKGWTGKTFDANGNFILDSIAMNASAHHIHNMLFMLGDKIDSSAEVDYMDVGVYRVRKIDSYDTVALRGRTAQGCELLYLASHATNHVLSPYLLPALVYEFENAVVAVNKFDQTNQCYVHHKNGIVEDMGNLGDPQLDMHSIKLTYMLEVMRGKRKLSCTPLTVIPHLRLVNAIYDKVEVTEFPEEFIVRNDERVYVKNLHMDLHNCFEQWKLPSELGYAWSVKETPVNVKEFTEIKEK